MDLMASRQTGFGIGPIWWGTIQEYCAAHGITGDQSEELHYHVRNMDEAYMKFYTKKHTKK